MSAPEMINELKRLSNVVTGLEDMIAQQIISNTNLISVITELQNQVDLQTTTNVSLTAMIAQLAASVVTLTTITGQLVEVNTRALDTTDRAHMNLPYDYIMIPVVFPNNIAQGAGDSFAVTQADWGVGLDFYVISVSISITITTAASYDKWMEGIWFHLQEAPGNTILLKNIVPKEHPAIGLTVDSATRYINETFPVKISRVNATSNLWLFVENYTGAQLLLNNINVYLTGVVI